MKDSIVEIRPAPWWLFVLVLAAVISMTAMSWFVPSWLWRPLFERSYGFVNLWYLAYSLLVVCGVLLGVGRRRPAELGLEWRELPSAVLYTCVVWIGLQVVLVGWYSVNRQSLDLADGWADANVVWKVGLLTSQLLGNALNEEIVYRGFLLMQLVLLLVARWPQQPRKAFLVSLLLASAFFAAMHVPDRLMRGSYTSLYSVLHDQTETFLNGGACGWLYWRTRNLFFVVGVHALSNLPTTLLAARGPLWRVDPWAYLLAIVIAVAWHRLPRTRQTLPLDR